VSKRVEVRISGLGGQGVILAGQILGRAAVHDGKYVVQTQSYGAEARGSAAKSEVIISDEKIGFPKVRKCDILVAVSQSALDTHLKDLKEDGVLLVDEDLVKEVPSVKARVLRVPATGISERELKSKIFANVVMLGALTKNVEVVSEKAMERGITESVSEKTREENIKAFRKGMMLYNRETQTDALSKVHT
jgi:2-oxoglutarate ferredoxin oxidoreductase subunit gamma